eukprot:scaffold258672_cov24-Tisochrysis_lutea.AAC.2
MGHCLGDGGRSRVANHIQPDFQRHQLRHLRQRLGQCDRASIANLVVAHPKVHQVGRVTVANHFGHRCSLGIAPAEHMEVKAALRAHPLLEGLPV